MPIRFLLALAALLLAGCASSDLSKDVDIAKEVEICLPPGTPAPVRTVRAVWFPSEGGSGGVEGSTVHVTGVLALAGNTLWFMSWNDQEHHFDMLHSIPVLKARRVSVSREGTGTLLVVEAWNESFDAFQLMGLGQVVSDPTLTRELADTIQKLRASAPAEDP
jgi:hypothetical protein